MWTSCSNLTGKSAVQSAGKLSPPWNDINDYNPYLYLYHYHYHNHYHDDILSSKYLPRAMRINGRSFIMNLHREVFIFTNIKVGSLLNVVFLCFLLLLLLLLLLTGTPPDSAPSSPQLLPPAFPLLVRTNREVRPVGGLRQQWRLKIFHQTS